MHLTQIGHSLSLQNEFIQNLSRAQPPPPPSRYLPHPLIRFQSFTTEHSARVYLRRPFSWLIVDSMDATDECGPAL